MLSSFTLSFSPLSLLESEPKKSILWNHGFLKKACIMYDDTRGISIIELFKLIYCSSLSTNLFAALLQIYRRSKHHGGPEALSDP